MSEGKERRGKYRRFSDRRIAVMLEIHERLFDLEPGRERDEALLDVLRDDFDTDLAAFLRRRGAGNESELVLFASSSTEPPTIEVFSGAGLRELLDVQQETTGAITLTRFRRPSVIEEKIWESLWAEDLGAIEATGLLTVSVVPERAEPFFIWLVLSGSSREWTSHDRDLAEEAANLIARASDKALR